MGKLQVYNASAGAGKTYTLAREYIKLLFKDKENYRKTLAVTFTNNACDEMKGRIVERLYDLSYKDDAMYRNDLLNYADLWKNRNLSNDEKTTEIKERAKEYLHEILHNYSFFFIETIDSFTQRIIRNFAKELNLPPKFTLELDSEVVLETLVKQILVDSLDNQELHKYLLDFTIEDLENNQGGHQSKLKDEIKSASKLLFEEKYQAKNDATLPIQEKMAGLTAFFENQKQKITDFELYKKEIIELAEKALQLIKDNGLEITSDFKSKSKSQVNRLKKIAEGDIFQDISGVLSVENVLSKDKAVEIQRLYDGEFLPIVEEIAQKATEDTPIVKEYYTAKKLLEQHQGIILSQYIQSKLSDYCKEENTFFLAYSNMFLKGIINESETPFVYEKIGQHIKNIMIDEFQDTSKMQWGNFLPIVSNVLAEGGYGLTIGDMKQAIYRFRNGDWKIMSDLLQDRNFSVDKSAEVGTNFRSCKNIVEFNNAFFKNYALYVENKFAADNAIDVRTTISDIYKTCEQKIQKEEPGCVEVRLINADGSLDAAGAREQRFEAIYEKVVELLQNGREPEDIMFLCYKHSVITELVDFFEQKKQEHKEFATAFSIVNKKALLVDEAPSVQFIVNYLKRMTMSSNDESISYVEATLAYNYNRLFQKVNCELSQMLDFQLIVDQIKTDSNDENNPDLITRNLSLFDTCEQIISVFGLNLVESEIPYLISFQEVVHSYSKNNNTNISRFLEHWEDVKGNTTLVQSDKIGCMKATTIHDSKGLEYPVVFLPDLYSEKQDSHIHALYEYPDTRLNLVKLDGDLKKTTLADSFLEEKYQIQIDSINAMYVACTRASEELYVYDVCTKATSKKGENKQLEIKKSFFEQCIEPLPFDTIDKENYIFIRGTYGKTKKKKTAPKSLNTYSVYKPSGELLPDKDANQMVEFFSKELSPRERGKLYHSILEHVSTISDVEKYVNYFCPIELFSDDAKQKLTAYLSQKMSGENVASWFDGNWDYLLSEQPLLFKVNDKTENRRPDRMIVRGNDVTIIDYKFTDEELSGNRETLRERHIKQVREYMDILSQMGYKPKGYIWYVDLDEIVTID